MANLTVGKTKSFFISKDQQTKRNYYVDSGTLASTVTEKNLLQKIFGYILQTTRKTSKLTQKVNSHASR